MIKTFQHSFDGPMEWQPLDAPSGTEFLNLADTSVRRLVKMAKQLAVLKKFEQEDQIALLKGSVEEVFIRRLGQALANSGAGLQYTGDKQVSLSDVAGRIHATPDGLIVTFFIFRMTKQTAWRLKRGGSPMNSRIRPVIRWRKRSPLDWSK